MKTIAFTALLLAACATSEEEDTTVSETAPREGEFYEIVPAEAQPALDEKGLPIPGTLNFDTSKGRMDITHLVPEAPREFGSWEEFHKWAAEQLNAEIVKNDEGELVSKVSAGYGPTLRFDAEKQDLVPVDDPIAAIVGGTWGYIYVGGERFCMDPAAACAAEQTVTPAQTQHHVGQVDTKSNNGLMVTGSSSIFHLFAVHEIKASTTLNASRGFQAFTYSCGFLGWGRCYYQSGTDSLSASFSAFRSTGSIFNGSASATQRDTNAIAASHWGFGVAYSSSSPVYISPGTAGIIQLTDSMCSRHSGNDNIGFVMFPTTSGYAPFGGC